MYLGGIGEWTTRRIRGRSLTSIVRIGQKWPSLNVRTFHPRKVASKFVHLMRYSNGQISDLQAASQWAL